MTWAEERRGSFYNPSANFQSHQGRIHGGVGKQSKREVSLSEFFLDFLAKNVLSIIFLVFLLGVSFDVKIHATNANSQL